MIFFCSHRIHKVGVAMRTAQYNPGMANATSEIMELVTSVEVATPVLGKKGAKHFCRATRHFLGHTSFKLLLPIPAPLTSVPLLNSFFLD